MQILIADFLKNQNGFPLCFNYLAFHATIQLQEVRHKVLYKFMDLLIYFIKLYHLDSHHNVISILTVASSTNLDRFIIDERVDSLVSRLLIGGVHLNSKLSTPCGDTECERSIYADSCQRDKRILNATFIILQKKTK